LYRVARELRRLKENEVEEKEKKHSDEQKRLFVEEDNMLIVLILPRGCRKE
jgi:hypothetical protein